MMNATMNATTTTMPKVFLETFGCQMNILDSELVEGQLKKAGYEFVASAEEANIVLLNTCSVRDLSEQKIHSRLGIIKDRKDKGEKVVVGVLGCMAERAHDELKRKRPFIDFLVGPSKLYDTKDLVDKAWHGSLNKASSLSYFVNRKGKLDLASMSPMDSLEALDRSRLESSTSMASRQAYVRITRGCNKFCSFCVVPRTRGPEMHRPAKSIIEEVRTLVKNGALEVTLLGQTINHYFYEDNTGEKWSFADLLRSVHDEVPDLPRLRFLTSYPRDFTDEALDVMAKSERICKYLHIPAQSGSNRVLKDMNRGYTVEEYLGLIHRAKSRMPNINFIGDMIVGFPGETDEDFAMSLELIKKVNYKNLYIFKYSPRPNTIANKNLIDNVPMEIKKQRHKIMLDWQNQINLENNKKLIGQTMTVLCEGPAKIEEVSQVITLRKKSSDQIKLMGRSEGDHIIHFYGQESLANKLIDVKITHARALSMDGEII